MWELKPSFTLKAGCVGGHSILSDAVFFSALAVTKLFTAKKTVTIHNDFGTLSVKTTAAFFNNLLNELLGSHRERQLLEQGLRCCKHVGNLRLNEDMQAAYDRNGQRQQ